MTNNNDLGQRLTPTPGNSAEPKPAFFNLQDSADQDRLNALLEKQPEIRVIDTYEGQLKEYFVLQNPWLNLDRAKRDQDFPAYRDEHYGQAEPWQAGVWVYLPWRLTLLHLLPDEMYQHVRTARNRNLITADEQQKYYNSTVAIAGQSVGNSCTLALVLMGGAKHLRLADPDILELTNLNRIRGSIVELTEPKVFMTARQIYELDPYADLKLYTEGLTDENLDEFVDGVDVLLDEMDNLELKIKLRQKAQEKKLPLIMATDNGDSGVLDVERHDLEDHIPVFHGRAGADLPQRVLGQKMPLPLLGKLIGEELLGYDLLEPAMQRSLLEIGKTIPTWPQLGGAAVLNGVAVAVAVRKIINGQPLVKDRAVLSLTAWLTPDYNSAEQVKAREEGAAKFAKEYNEAIEQALKHMQK